MGHGATKGWPSGRFRLGGLDLGGGGTQMPHYDEASAHLVDRTEGHFPGLDRDEDGRKIAAGLSQRYHILIYGQIRGDALLIHQFSLCHRCTVESITSQILLTEDSSDMEVEGACGGALDSASLHALPPLPSPPLHPEPGDLERRA